jgi:hypothetical protein
MTNLSRLIVPKPDSSSQNVSGSGIGSKAPDLPPGGCVNG